MENDINSWLSFTAEVEEKLQTINPDIFSETYRSELLSLLSDIKREVSEFSRLSPIQKQESYFKINSLGQNLRLSAYFA